MKRQTGIAMVSGLGLGLVLAGNIGRAADLPEPVLPAGVGVNIHFTRGHGRELDLLAAAGFKFVRMDFSWAGTERQRGRYDWSAYDALTHDLEARGLRALYILDYSNPLYERTIVRRDPVSHRERRDVASPQTPASVEAFARWAAAAVYHFRGRHIIWEIWNEPNIHFWKPKPDVRQYIALAKATCDKIRMVVPQATIVAPASSGFPWSFFETFFKSGILEQLDAVTVHPYRAYSQGPETAGADYARLRALIRRYAPVGKKTLPVLSGEWGYATHTHGVSLDTQAAFVARQQLANLLHGVPLSIWYDWRNDGRDPNEGEHNFGVVDADMKPKPAYVAVKTLTRELNGFRVRGRINTERAEDYLLRLGDRRGLVKLAVWTTGNPHTIVLDRKQCGGRITHAVNGFGKPLTIQQQTDRVHLPLRAVPSYLTVKQ